MNKKLCLIACALFSITIFNVAAMAPAATRQPAAEATAVPSSSTTTTSSWKKRIKSYVDKHRAFSAIAAVVLAGAITRDLGGPNIIETFTSHLSYIPRTLLTAGALAIWAYALA